MIRREYIDRKGNPTYDEYEWIEVGYYPTGGYFHINELKLKNEEIQDEGWFIFKDVDIWKGGKR